MGSFEIGSWKEGGWNDKTNEAKSLDYEVIGNWFADDLGKCWNFKNASTRIKKIIRLKITFCEIF